MSHLTIDIPENDHSRLKRLAALSQVTMKELVLDCLRERLSQPRRKINGRKRSVAKRKVPNALTRKVFSDADAGRSLKSFKSAKALLDDLKR